MSEELRDATKTAVIVPLRQAEEVVAPYRQTLDHTASWPLPAHVTVLYPFVAPEHVTRDVIGRLRTCLAAIPAFTCSFSRTAWFGQDVMWLAPEPDAPFRALTAAVAHEFPECPPYQGRHPDPTPHLTVGSSHLADLSGMQQAATELRATLPIRARVGCVRLMAGGGAPGSWHTVCEFVLPPGDNQQ